MIALYEGFIYPLVLELQESHESDDCPFFPRRSDSCRVFEIGKYSTLGPFGEERLGSIDAKCKRRAHQGLQT